MATENVGNVSTIVLPGKFDPKKDSWENYREQLFFAFETGGNLTSAQKRALFLSQCGKEAYSLIVSLLSPRKLSTVEFDDIISVLDKFFILTPHPILEVDKFYKRKQREGESITNFVAALREISANCRFEGDNDRRIVEQLILGARNQQLRKELLKIKWTDLSYGIAVQQALNFEALVKGMCDIQLTENGAISGANGSQSTQGSCEPMEVNKINSPPAPLCIHCGKRHGNAKCRFRNATCHKCQRKGHVKAACKNVNKINKCEEIESDCESSNVNSDDNFGMREDGVDAVAGDNRVEPLMAEVTLNGIPVKMEVDSGSARTIIPHTIYKLHSRVFPALSQCNNKLVTWTNNVLKLEGVMWVNVSYRDKNVVLPAIVSDGRGPPLLGRAWFEPLGISVQGVNTVSDTNFHESMMSRFPNLFNDDLDRYSGPTVHIECKQGASPVFHRARPVPFPLRDRVNKELNRLIENGILTPVKHSRWATPLTIVSKPDGSLRLCGDYRSTVNACCVLEKYPLPTCNESFFSLAGGKYFTKIDLKQAYNLLKVDEETAELLTLNTTLGLMKVNRLAYGVNVATAVFQRLMNSVLAGIEGVACLLDDVVVSGATCEQHDQRVEEVLNRLDKLGLTVNKSKCVFRAERVTFLGYEIDSTGVHPTKDKIDEIINKPSPSDKRSLKAFLGLYNFYERFLKDKAVVLEPLYKLLKKNAKWEWGEKQQVAFNKAKSLLTSDLTLVHYSLERELIMIADASDYGLGVALVHVMDDGTERPVIMGSRTLQAHERRYAQIDKEALAIMFGLKKFKQYLLGRRFTIVTDHKPLLGIFGRSKPIPELVSSRMLRWALTLNTFDYELKYRPGKDIGVADSLSRWPTVCNDNNKNEDVMLLEEVDEGMNAKEIAKETDRDKILKRVKFFLLHGWPEGELNPELLPYQRRKDSLSLNKDCVMLANRVVIPEKLKKPVLKILHQNHSGVVQTKMCARGYIWYPNLDNDIENMVAECEVCQLSRNNPPTTEHCWQAATKPWSRIHIDFMGPYMGKTFLVIVDSYSKWPIVEIVPSMSSKTVIEILRKVFADYGLPDILVSDNGLAFTSSEFSEFLKKNHVQHITGAPYHPATNGQAERMIQTIKAKLNKQPPSTSWTERVARMLFLMRTAPSTVNGKTPAELLTGRRFKTHLSVVHPDMYMEESREQEKEKVTTKKKSFKVGDYVLMRLYNMNSKWQRGKVVRSIEPAVYEVEVDGGARHRRHVDQLLLTRPPNSIQSDPDLDYDCDSQSSNDVIVPPPEEWPEIIGV